MPPRWSKPVTKRARSTSFDCQVGHVTRLPGVRSAVPPSQGPRRDRKADLRSSLAGPREEIAHAPDGLHHPRLARVVLELFAKLVDVRVERATRDAVRVAPYLAHQLRARHHHV